MGHDYRSYSEEVKKKLIEGLISTGCNVEDIGLSLSPMTYFSQFELNADSIAMVTASHNENGWTGIKMGIDRGLTHSSEEYVKPLSIPILIPVHPFSLWLAVTIAIESAFNLN